MNEEVYRHKLAGKVYTSIGTLIILLLELETLVAVLKEAMWYLATAT